MRALAEEAEVSLRHALQPLRLQRRLLYALLNASLEERRPRAVTYSSSKRSSVLEVRGSRRRSMARDAAFYRPLMQFLLGARDVEHRPRFMSRACTLDADGTGGRRQGLLPIDRHRIAGAAADDQFHRSADLWIHKSSTTTDSARRASTGFTLWSGQRPEEARPRLVERLKSIERRLPRELALPGEVARATRSRRNESRQPETAAERREQGESMTSERESSFKARAKGAPDPQRLSQRATPRRSRRAVGLRIDLGVEHHFTEYTMCPDVLQYLTYSPGARTRSSSARWSSSSLARSAARRRASHDVDHFSNGPLIFGIGRGLGRVEFEASASIRRESRERFVEAGR